MAKTFVATAYDLIKSSQYSILCVQVNAVQGLPHAPIYLIRKVALLHLIQPQLFALCVSDWIPMISIRLHYRINIALTSH